MINFKLLAQGLPVGLLVSQLVANRQLWDQITARQDYPGPHRDTRTIFVLGPRELTVQSVQEDLGVLPYEPAYSLLFNALHQVLQPAAVALRVKEPGRVLLVELKPGGLIDPHVDEGSYAEHFERFHIPLITDEFCRFTCDGEDVYMAPGELWWFDHRKLHSVRNFGTKPRVHLIFDAVRA